uniref:RNA-binding protein RO60 vWA domain-containing protein n=1 Tax=Hucho hucho TaxID=62062 RepID=A0A4W5PP11_9TELE
MTPDVAALKKVRQNYPFSILARFVVAVDISTSLSSIVQGTSVSTAVMAAAMAMVTLLNMAHFFDKTCLFKSYDCGSQLTAASSICSQIPSGYTDCALPILWASEKGITVDMFIIFTNSACWHGQPGGLSEDVQTCKLDASR